jgi:hypothetical protein
LKDERLQINGTPFSSKQLHDQFAAAKVHSAVLVVVSAGERCEERAHELWLEGKPDEYFFLEMYGSAVVEHLVAGVNGRICGWADQQRMFALPHYSPGYTGWDVSDQLRLWSLIRRDNTISLPGELLIMDSGMPRPKKSLLALVGITHHVDNAPILRKMVPCESCSLPRCQYRRAPYVNALPQIEDVSRIQARADSGTVETASRSSPLTYRANYSVNLNALRKWSRERLQLQELADGSVEARFRYEGTTCSNLGRPLEYEYHIKLGAPTEGYIIDEALCVPAPGDAGHASQCEYLTNAESFARSVAGEKPLLGRPLDDVLTWKRPHAPSGCYCDTAKRLHKWGLVFEVIHYALAQREKDRNDTFR